MPRRLPKNERFSRYSRREADTLYRHAKDYLETGRTPSDPHVAQYWSRMLPKQRRAALTDIVTELHDTKTFGPHSRKLAEMIWQQDEGTRRDEQYFRQLLSTRQDGKATIDSIYGVLGNMRYETVMNGLFLPDVGVIGDWDGQEIAAVREMYSAPDQQQGIRHEFGRDFFSDNPYVEQYRPTFTALVGMKEGDVKHIDCGGLKFIALRLPGGNAPAIGRILLLK